MRKFYILYILFVLLFIVCSNDTESPVVEIVLPEDGAYVTGNVVINIEASDNNDLRLIELFIDALHVITFEVEPDLTYGYIWNTDSLEHGSTHSIYALAYDASDNIGISDTISVIIQYQPGDIKWRCVIGGDLRASPAIGADGTIYVGSNNCLYAINQDGTIRWQCQVGSWITQSSPVIGSDQTIYFASYDSPAHCSYLNAITPDGSILWRYEVIHAIFSTPALGPDGTIYFKANKYVYAINPDGTLKWQYDTEAMTRYAGEASPSIGSDGTIYIGGCGAIGYLLAINPDSTLKWSFDPSSWFLGGPAIGADGTLYIGTVNGLFYALNPEDGSVKWQAQVFGVMGSPIIDSQGDIYVHSHDKLVKLSSDGAILWEYFMWSPFEETPAVDQNGVIYAAREDGTFYAFSSDGEVMWSVDLVGFVYYSAPAISSDSMIYIGTRDGYLYAIVAHAPLANSSWPMFHHDAKHTGRVGGGF